MKLGPVSLRLARDAFHPDEDVTAIAFHHEVVGARETAAVLLRICPARVYREGEDGSIQVESAACLECGACRVVAGPGTLSWSYPRGGFGVAFREG